MKKMKSAALPACGAKAGFRCRWLKQCARRNPFYLQVHSHRDRLAGQAYTWARRRLQGCIDQDQLATRNLVRWN